MIVAAAGRRITRLSIYLLMAAALFLPSSASADPITVTPVRITGGSLVSDAEGRAQLIFAGTGGFGLSGVGSFRFFQPYGQCLDANACMPGDPISLAGHWDGSDLNGTMTFGGAVHPVGIWTEENATTIFNFAGSVLAPAFDGSLTSVVSAPFMFNGRVLLPAVPPLHFLDATGSGLATIRLRWSNTEAERGWRFDGASYTFNTATPVPEPGTIALVGLGIAGLAARRARRRGSASSRTRV